jgi:thiosulfate reductase cytochrome b subunit
MKNTKKVYVYKGFERFWHWTQALLIMFLALTGFEIHSSYSLFGFETAVNLHNKAAWGNLCHSATRFETTIGLS